MFFFRGVWGDFSFCRVFRARQRVRGGGAWRNRLGIAAGPIRYRFRRARSVTPLSRDCPVTVPVTLLLLARPLLFTALFLDGLHVGNDRQHLGHCLRVKLQRRDPT